MIVKFPSRGFRLDQPMLVNKITNLLPSTIQTCMIQSSDLVSNPSNGSLDIDYLTQSGCLLYLVQGSCPDITFAVNFLARFSVRPNTHWATLKHLISYVRYLSNLSLPIIASRRQDSAVTTFVDSNWGGEGVSR